MPDYDASYYQKTLNALLDAQKRGKAKGSKETITNRIAKLRKLLTQQKAGGDVTATPTKMQTVRQPATAIKKTIKIKEKKPIFKRVSDILTGAAKQKAAKEKSELAAEEKEKKKKTVKADFIKIMLRDGKSRDQAEAAWKKRYGK